MIATETTGGVRVERNVIVPLSDGTEIAADVYLPPGPGPHPALLSFYPYRKDDVIGGATEYARRWFAERGYAGVLADFRGTGGSTGAFTPFEADAEGRDGAEIVEWMAAQDWCDGAVGIYGISYGGLIALSIAAHAPRHLKAIAPMYGPPDIWHDYVAPGGAPNCLGNFARENFMLALELAPPGFQDADGRWLRVWRERLDRVARDGVYSLRFQRHGGEDEFWRRRAVPLDRVETPSYFVAGWRDLFPDAVPASFAAVPAPKKLLAGPWLHVPPDMGSRDRVDWLAEVERWWAYWLRGEDNGVLDEPPVTLYVEGAGWRHEQEWPPARARERVLVQGGGADYEGDPTVGTAAPLFDPLGLGVGYPREQAEDDARSLCFTSEPLEEDVEVVGSPLVEVALETDAELQLTARLAAVAPDGTSSLVTLGWATAGPGAHELRVPLWATAYRIPRGHRVRLALACADFPHVWPTTANPRLRVERAELRAPVAPPGEPAEPPLVGDESRAPWLVSAHPRWDVSRDLVADAVTVTLGTDLSIAPPSGVEVRLVHRADATVVRARPDGAAVNAVARMELRMPAGERIAVDTRCRFTRDTMTMHGRVEIDGTPFFEHDWSNL